MTDEVKTEPCLKGLTPACWKAHPAYAKRMFAYRLLQLLLPFGALKRLQKIPGAIWRRPLLDVPGISLTPTAPFTLLSFVEPLFVGVWEPGPITTVSKGIGGIVMPVILKAKINISSTATETVIAGVTGSKICIAAMGLTVAGETNLTLKSGSTAISGAMDFGGADEPRGLTQFFGDYPLKMTVDEAFVISRSLDIQVSGYVTYYLE